jgi:hypothetical protein
MITLSTNLSQSIIRGELRRMDIQVLFALLEGARSLKEIISRTGLSAKVVILSMAFLSENDWISYASTGRCRYASVQFHSE